MWFITYKRCCSWKVRVVVSQSRGATMSRDEPWVFRLDQSMFKNTFDPRTLKQLGEGNAEKWPWPWPCPPVLRNHINSQVMPSLPRPLLP